MAGGSGTRFVDKLKVVTALHPIVPSTSTPRWVSLKGYNHALVIVNFTNATTVTGSAISLLQSAVVAGSSSKALAFTKMWACLDDASAVALTETAVVSNTFTTLTTNSKTGFYLIEIDADTLDVANKFCCFRAVTADATAATIEVTYLLGNVPRYGGAPEYFMNPCVD